MKKHSVLYKYFITYAAIILAVCLAASFAFFFFTFNQHKKSIEGANILRLDEAQKALDSDFNQCLYITRKLVKEYGTEYWFQRNLETPSQIKAVLGDYMINNGHFADVILVTGISKGTEAVYYNTTGMVTGQYFDNYYGFDKLTQKWLSENLSEIRYPFMVQSAKTGFSSNIEETVNLLIVPLDMFIEDERFDATIFIFNNSELIGRMIGTFPDGAANAMILSEKDEIIVCDSEIESKAAAYKSGVGGGNAGRQKGLFCKI